MNACIQVMIGANMDLTSIALRPNRAAAPCAKAISSVCLTATHAAGLDVIMARYLAQWLASFLFVVQMYLAMAVLAAFFMPAAVIDKRWAYRGIRTYCNWVRASAATMVGLKSEIRGDPPTGHVLVCSKHQSFFDILMLCSVLPEPRFVMKKQLASAPIIGYFARKIGCIPVDRGKKSFAIKQMLQGARQTGSASGQLVIYPEGTRVAPGMRKDYKIGAGILYDVSGCPCVPAATNVGVFWPRRRIYRERGTAILEFLPEIPPGLEAKQFMEEIRQVIESSSDRLMEEAGFVAEAAD